MFLRLLLLLTICCTPSNQTRIISSSCTINEDGSRCKPLEQTWESDGVCKYDASRNTGTCIGPKTRKLKLTVVIRYRSLSTRSRGGPPIIDMYMKGSGPGLSWDSTLKLNRSGRAVDRWTAELPYWVDSNGLPCVNIRHCTLNQFALEFRLYRDSFGNQPMNGPNFFIPLPLSDSITGAVSFRSPEVNVYPWFYRDKIRNVSFIFTMSEEIATRDMSVQCSLLYPPSFSENVRKSYPLVIMFGISIYYTPLLEYLFTYEGSVEELVILMIDLPTDSELRRMFNFLPFSSNSELSCRSEDSASCYDCQSCWVPTRAEACERDEFVSRIAPCLTLKSRSGIGEPFMESIIKELIGKVQEMTSNRIRYDPPRERVTLMAHTDLSVLVTHTAVTQPDIVGNVACFSPRFFLPLNSSYLTSSGILDTISQQEQIAQFNAGIQALHSTQKYYFDHGEDDNFFFPLADAIETTAQVINDLKDKLSMKDDTNILHFMLPKERLDYTSNTPPDILSRLKYPLVSFFRPNGGPNRDYVRNIKVTESFIANRITNLVESDSDESIINIIANNNTIIINNVNKNRTTNNRNTFFTNDESFDDYCASQNIIRSDSVPLGVFIGALALCTAVSIVITVVLMCVRESNRKAAEKEEKEEQELLEDLSSDDDIDID